MNIRVLLRVMIGLVVFSVSAMAEERAVVDAVFQQGSNGYTKCKIIDPWNTVVARKTLTINKNTIVFENLRLAGEDVKIEKARLEMFFHEEGWSRVADAQLELHDGAVKDSQPLSVKPYQGHKFNGRKANKSWLSWEIPGELVSRWIKDPAANKGVRFKVIPGRKDNFQFVFAGPAAEFAAHRPRLVITYSFTGNAAPFIPEFESIIADKTFGPMFTLKWKTKRWDPNGTPVTYEVEVGSEGDGFKSVGSCAAGKGALQVKTADLKEGASYCIRMRAIDPEGLKSDWSQAPGTFRVSRDEFVVWTAPSTTKVKPGQNPPSSEGRAVMAAARNEHESVQIVVCGLSDMKGIDVRLSDLKGVGDAMIPSAAGTLYRVNYVDCEGQGLLPDSMVPFIDPISGKRIGGAYGVPFDVAAGSNVPIWLELHIPADAVPGDYQGTITISRAGEGIAVVPLDLTVWPITLPKTTELLTYFCLSWNKHPKRAYLHSLHEHRIDVWYVQGPGGEYGHRLNRDANGNAVVDWDSEMDKVIESYFDGSFFKDGVPGKTYLFGYGMWHLLRALQNNEQDRIDILKQFEEHYGQKPWIKNVAWFFIDEPKKGTMGKCCRVGEQIRDHSPSIGYLLTTRYHEELKGLVTVWDSIINSEIINWDAPGPRIYQDEMKAGRHAINCITVNSNVPTSPNLFIHHPGMNTRIWTWATWALGQEGIEFWDSKPAPSVTVPKKYGKAWGDGSLFYQGLPKELGIPEEIALPSIRLKMLRDGIEDFELLSMLKKKNPVEAARIGRMMCQETVSYDKSFKTPIQHISWNWNKDGKGDRQVPGFIVWESSYEGLSAARAAMAEALAGK